MKKNMTWKELKRIHAIDGIYGFGAILVVFTGVLNWMMYGKGTEYYNSNMLFMLKLSLFIIVGLLSIYPTVLFFRYKKRFKNKQTDPIEFKESDRVKKVILSELIILSLIPLLAELMANGIDL